MIVLHAGVCEHRLVLWGEAPMESQARARQRGGQKHAESLPYDAGAERLCTALREVGFAFIIGQTKNVQVHKFLCVGTLEEKIDEMIERKKEVAEKVVGTGEGWLTELSTAELKELFTLRKEAVEE